MSKIIGKGRYATETYPTVSDALVISKNGEFIGGGTLNDASTAAGAQSSSATASNNNAITSQRRLTLNTGDTLQPLGATFGVAEDLLINGLTMTVLPQ
jgi:hypothetical protein